jgi:DNA-directed RNA polymerase specialized sigma24 family protein
MQTSRIEILATRAQLGDRKAADALAREVFTRYAAAIAARAHLTGDRDEAESIAHFAFLAALRCWKPGDSFAGFFVGQLESRCLTFARGRARHNRKKAAVADALDPADFTTRPAETAPDADVALRVAARVLSPAEMRVFEAARRTDELNTIAEACGISRQAATRALDRAISKIRAALELPTAVVEA